MAGSKQRGGRLLDPSFDRLIKGKRSTKCKSSLQRCDSLQRVMEEDSKYENENENNRDHDHVAAVLKVKKQKSAKNENENNFCFGAKAYAKYVAK